MKTKIFLKSLSIETIIGIKRIEKKTPQRLIIDLSIVYDAKKAMQSDDINDAISYENIALFCYQFARNYRFDLVESFSYQLSQSIFKKFQVESLKIKITKKGLIEDCQGYGVVAHFHRFDFN